MTPTFLEGLSTPVPSLLGVTGEGRPVLFSLLLPAPLAKFPVLFEARPCPTTTFLIGLLSTFTSPMSLLGAGVRLAEEWDFSSFVGGVDVVVDVCEAGAGALLKKPSRVFWFVFVFFFVLLAGVGCLRPDAISLPSIPRAIASGLRRPAVVNT